MKHQVGSQCLQCVRTAIYCRGLCKPCYARHYYADDLDIYALPTTRKVARSNKAVRRKKSTRSVRSECRYAAAHKRVTSLWGSANQYPCIECGKYASEWAYDGTDATELSQEETRPHKWCILSYSRYPEFYMPMCTKCHRRRDGLLHRQEVREFLAWKANNRNTELSGTMDSSGERYTQNVA